MLEDNPFTQIQLNTENMQHKLLYLQHSVNRLDKYLDLQHSVHRQDKYLDLKHSVHRQDKYLDLQHGVHRQDKYFRFTTQSTQIGQVFLLVQRVRTRCTDYTNIQLIMISNVCIFEFVEIRNFFDIIDKILADWLKVLLYIRPLFIEGHN